MYTNVYDKKIARKSNKASTLAPAVNDAANQIITLLQKILSKLLINKTGTLCQIKSLYHLYLRIRI